MSGTRSVGDYSWRDDPNFGLRQSILGQQNQNRDMLIRRQQDQMQLAERLAQQRMNMGQVQSTGRFDLARRLLGF